MTTTTAIRHEQEATRQSLGATPSLLDIAIVEPGQ